MDAAGNGCCVDASRISPEMTPGFSWATSGYENMNMMRNELTGLDSFIKLGVLKKPLFENVHPDNEMLMEAEGFT